LPQVPVGALLMHFRAASWRCADAHHHSRRLDPRFSFFLL
jgi:hypothetical protein